jgi:Caspase domain
MHGRTFLVLLGVLLLSGGSRDALAESRVALVIGNSGYRNVPKLPNPGNDAEAVGILLKSAGFDLVEMRRDLGIADMRRSINDFSDLTQNADIAVVFYAGHGIEVDGTNYLVPVDAKLGRDLDVEDETVSVDRILRVIEPAKRLRLIILDACRDNPFAKTMKRTVASRSVGRGLGRVEPPTSDTLIAFAVKAGSTAADGDGVHSPFTAALLRHLVTPGLDVRLAFGQVRDDVMKATSKRQEPFVYGSLGGGVVTLASLTNTERDGAASLDPNATAAREYEAAAKIGTKEAWDAFLTTHPTEFYAELARLQRAKLTSIAPTAQPNPVAPNKKNVRPTGVVPKQVTGAGRNRKAKNEAEYIQMWHATGQCYAGRAECTRRAKEEWARLGRIGQQ